ncbi:MAG: signal peptidase I [Lentisphaeria bacterium]|nr:signal peptidase I [Lentisphaeria bacterium]
MPNKFSEYLKLRKARKRLKELFKAACYRYDCDRDILSETDCTTLNGIIEEAESVCKQGADEITEFVDRNCSVVDRMNPLQNKTARSIRSFLDILAVAFGVAFGIRALYLQPFKIPTGSMQPTLFGIHYVDRAGLEKHGSSLSRFLIPLTSPRAYLKVQQDGELSRSYKAKNSLFSENTQINIGGVDYVLPGNFGNIYRYMDCMKDQYQKGEVLCDGWLVTGDHLFVERVSIYFRGIKRGDVAVFNTENIVSENQPLGGYYYIKRIVGLPGDTIRIDGNILKIRKKGETEFQIAAKLHPGFAKTDSMKGGYHGHIADGILADGQEVTVPKNHYFALGDNTSNSLDGRHWGFIPRRNMIGLAVNVFWPVTRRWGFVDTLDPIDEPTRLPYSMEIQ